MNDSLRTIPELCLEMECIAALAPTRALLRTAATAFGGSYFLFGMRGGKAVSPPVQIAITNYPKRWQSFYDETRAMTYDPVISRAFQFSGPFRWDGLYQTPEQIQLYKECARHGMQYGIACSDRGRDGAVSVLCICGDRPIAPETAQWGRAAASLSLLVTTTQKTVSRILEARAGRKNGYGFTNAELRTLQLTADTLTAEEVAIELGVTARTVRYYLDRAAIKLGAASRKEAVVRAVAEGLVDNRQFPPTAFGPGIERF